MTNHIRRRQFITLLGGAAVAWPLAARAQQDGRVRIGLSAVAPTTAPRPLPAAAGGRVTSVQFDGGFPDASNTGPAPGTVFTNVSGLVSTTANGQVLQNLNIGNNGAILINHSNVTVRDCIISAGNNFFAITDNGGTGMTGLLVERVRMVGGVNGGIAVGGLSNSEVRFCDISGFENGILPGGPGWNMHDSYIHDLAGTPGVAHVDGIQNTGSFALGTMSVTIRHNTIISWDTSGVILGNGNWNGITIDNNRILTDPNHPVPGDKSMAYGIVVGIGSTDIGTVTNVVITNNRITTDVIYPIYLQKVTSTTTVTGNVFDQTGLPITPTIET